MLKYLILTIALVCAASAQQKIEWNITSDVDSPSVRVYQIPEADLAELKAAEQALAKAQAAVTKVRKAIEAKSGAHVVEARLSTSGCIHKLNDMIEWRQPFLIITINRTMNFCSATIPYDAGFIQ